MSDALKTGSAPQKRASAAISRRAEDLENLIQIGIENGLFACDNADPKPMIEAVAQARSLNAKGETEAAASELSHGEYAFHRRLYERGRFPWRLIHLHQIPLLIYYVVVLVCVLNVGTGYWGFVAEEVWTLPMAALGFGALGAVLRGLWWLYKHVAKRSFRVSFIQPHLAAPWVGALFGLLTYLLLQAGVVSLEGAAAGDAELDQAVLPMALAFLAGFSWEWVLERVERIRDRGGKGATRSATASPSPQSVEPRATS